MTDLSELTKYPKIFKQCYWGAFKDTVDWKDQYKINIDNRNNLVEQYKITCCREKIPQNKIKFFEIPGVIEFFNGIAVKLDHCEYYYTQDKKHILIFSDGLHFNEENYDILLQNGYIEYPTIYIDIPTFMKIV